MGDPLRVEPDLGLSTRVAISPVSFAAQGNTAHLMHADGLVIAHSAYDAWGQLMAGANATPYGYKGQWGYYTDSETGLLLLTHRYLDPTTGRFLTRDPIGLEGGINLYAYVGNGVVTDKDPFGLTVQFCTRPVCDPVDEPWACHWFLTSSQCGCIGYGNQGVFFNCEDHYGDYKPSCKTVPTTPAQEKCLCDLANNASRGWVMCGEKWLPEGKGKGEYNWLSHNCQYFVICLAKKCGLKYHFPGPLRPYQPRIW